MARLSADWGHSLSCDIGATLDAGERAALQLTLLIRYATVEFLR